jgi:glucose uptake protein GlcU
VRVAAGFALSLLSAVCFGLYVLPRRQSSLPAPTYLTSMAVGFSIPAALVLWALHVGLGEAWPRAIQWVQSGETGALWAGANLAYVLAIDRTGVARATAVKNLTGLFGTLAGVVLVGEEMRAWAAAALLLGSALLAWAATVLGRLQWSPGGSPGGKGGAGGYLLALLAAMGLGVYLVPGLPAVRAGMPVEMFVAAFALAAGACTVAGASAWALASRQPLWPSRKEAGRPLLAGLLWFGGSAAVTPASFLVGLAVSWPLSQLGFFLTLAYAAARLGEVDLGEHRRAVAGASALTLAGMALLAVARASSP